MSTPNSPVKGDAPPALVLGGSAAVVPTTDSAPSSAHRVSETTQTHESPVEKVKNEVKGIATKVKGGLSSLNPGNERSPTQESTPDKPVEEQPKTPQPQLFSEKTPGAVDAGPSVNPSTQEADVESEETSLPGIATDSGEEWMRVQDRRSVPHHRALTMQVEEGLKHEEETRAAEERLARLDAGLDPRHSFRPPIYKDKGPQPGWLEKTLEDYHGIWWKDVLAVLGIALFFVALPFLVAFLFLTYLSVSKNAHQFVEPTCAYSLVKDIASWGPSAGLPDVCTPNFNQTPSSTFPIVLDPLGIARVNTWRVTLPHFKKLNTTAAKLPSYFSPIDQDLRLATANYLQPVKHLSRKAGERQTALETVLKETSKLTQRYEIYINDLILWSHWAVKDMHSAADSQEGIGASLNLLWGPVLSYKTPLGEVKEKLELAVKELIGDVGKLEGQTNHTTDAIKEARESQQHFAGQITKAEAWFSAKCVGTNFLGWESLRRDLECQGWDPRRIGQAMPRVEKEENKLLNAVEEHVEELVKGVEGLRTFYNEVLAELGEVKSREFGDVKFDTLESLRSFVGRFEDRTSVTAGVLKDRMGK